MGGYEIYEDQHTLIRQISEKTGHVVTESILTNDKLDCATGPAYREFDEMSGKVKCERWLSGGLEHRWSSDRPSETIWDTERDVIVRESFMQLGKYHRENHRPARIWYSLESEHIVREEFWINNQLHRDNNLPAIVTYDEINGKILLQEFYQYGKKIQPPQPTPKL